LRQVHDLTERMVVSEILDLAGKPASKPLLVYFERASASATRILREHRISFIGKAGQCFLFHPPLLVDRELPPIDAPMAEPLTSVRADERNPFGRTGSRVLRWLLLHPLEEFSMHDLTRDTGLSGALVSRVVHALDSEAWIDLTPDRQDRRVRRVRMRRPRQALAAWSQAWERRRVPAESWNIRADGVEAAMRRLMRVKKHNPDLRWAVGGLAGASLIERVAEPATTLLWVSRDHLEGLRTALAPTRSLRAQPSLRVALAPDDFIFELAEQSKGVPVVDRVQLWLDCSGEGERALQAADAITRGMGW